MTKILSIMNILKFKTAVANKNVAMKSDTISKNRRNLKSHTVRKNFLLIACFTLLSAFYSCNKNKEDDKQPVDLQFIDSKLVGKWEMLSTKINGIKYDLPYPDEPVGFNTAGLEFTASSWITFMDGIIVDKKLSGVYTSGNRLYFDFGDFITWQLSDNTLTITTTTVSVFQKVSKFSWEL